MPRGAEQGGGVRLKTGLLGFVNLLGPSLPTAMRLCLSVSGLVEEEEEGEEEGKPDVMFTFPPPPPTYSRGTESRPSKT